MSDWCKLHPKYGAKRRPVTQCSRCWKLYFLKNPEEKQEVFDADPELGTRKP